jgi:rRNA maturation protein Nop10
VDEEGEAMSFTSKPAAVEVCSCGAEFIPASRSLGGSEHERTSFREAHAECRQRAEWQRCPVCGGRGSVPHGFYSGFAASTSTMREQCRACTGSGLLARPSSQGVQLAGAAA